ncbi:hypothetical protein [Baekduia sp. Peel2402]|uniref:hypothetical protein n=1 Tax=Baekduia sp. Peel2402 TaxID=3458296 RepID=UPI00403EDD32
MTDTATTTPAPPAVASRRRSVTLPDWAPGVLLLAGLALVWLLVRGADEVDLHQLHLIHADGASTHEVAQFYVPDWLSPNFNPFVEDRLRAITPLLTILQFVSVAAIGATLIAAIPGAAAWPRTVRVLGGFLPGFLMVLAPLQILFAAVSPVTGSHIALVALPLTALAIQHKAVVEGAQRIRRGERPALLGAVAIAAGVLVVCALDRLQAGRFFMVPDSITAFLQASQAQVAGQLGDHLAQWDQQSDEWIFNAPLLFSARGAQDQLFAFWLTQAMAMASFGALVFGLARHFAWRRRTLAATIATGAVLASTPAIVPWDNVSLIGGQNPALWLGHPGRMVSIVAPFVALLLLGPWTRRQAVAVLFAATGLAFVTVNGVAYTFVAVACAIAWRVLRGRVRGGPVAVKAVLVNVCVVAALASPLYVYWAIHRTDYPDDLGWWLVIGSALAMAAAIVLALTTRPDGDARAPITWHDGALRAAAVGVVILAGFFLSNNQVSDFADGGVRRAIGHVLPGFSQPVTSRGLLGDKHLEFPLFAGQECSISGHCLTFGWFLGVYGFTLVLALAAWLALGRVGGGERADRRHAVWLVVIAVFVASLALLDFTGVDLITAWVLTRFVEVPYYAIIAFAALAFAGSRSRVTMGVGTAVLAVWTVVPLVHSHIPEQIYKNADWLIARAGG